ncbi:MAG: DUF1559 domain-containing protein [Planctomycetes bacterium]|nr:DUF1559 domain-containing protein [Planctomycetota bacterium]
MIQQIQRLVTLLIVLGFFSGTLFAAEGSGGVPWTLDEALEQLELYPHDAYLQYVALQLARRGDEDEFKRVVKRLRGTVGRRGQRNRSGRRAQIDLFSLTSGALAVQESLQLDAMTADVDGGFVDPRTRQRRRSPTVFHGTPTLARKMKQLGLAMHNYHDAMKKFPTAATYDSKGQPLLSWRVQLLPYLDQQKLYEQFHLDEPWDSPHNKTLIAKIPKAFQSPENPADKKHKTRFLVPVGKTTIFPGRKAMSFASIRDGSSNTIMLVQVASESAVVWTKPDDLQFDPKSPLTGIAEPKQGWFQVTMADASTRSIPTTVKPELLRNLFGRADGQLINWEDVYTTRPANPTDRDPTNIEIGELTGPTVRSHPFEEMLAGQTPKVSELAAAVPEDFYYVRFRSLGKLLDMAENSDLWAAHLFSQSVQNSYTHRTAVRLQEQLCVETNDLLRPFYDSIVQEVAVTGSDLFLREGTDVTLLFRFDKEAVFKMQMNGFLVKAAKKHPKSTRSTGSYRGVAFEHLTTPDRQAHVFSAYPQKGLHVRSNSRVAFERILDTLQGRGNNASDSAAPKTLADAFEFRYMRTLYEMDAPEEDGFIYLSDAFIRELVGPVRKITERRRVQCYNHLRMLGHASMLYRTEHGEAPRNLDQLIKTECLPKEFGTGKLSCPDGGRYQLSEAGMKCSCTVHGHVGRLTPCCEIPVQQITATEQKLYQRFLQGYNRYWQTFFDPIGIRVKATPASYRLETIILPLIDNSIYTTMAQLLGGTPKQLDNLPVPKRNIFSLGLKFDKEKLIESEAAAEVAAASNAELRDMKNIALAFHNYASAKKRFPPNDKKEGGLSWRVHLLPYLGAGQLHARFKLDEPWDSRQNIELLKEMPEIYGEKGTTTRIVGFTGEGAPFGKAQGLRFRDVQDGLSNTILVVEAGPDRAVPWTKPADLPFDQANPLAALGTIPGDEFKAAFMDGSIQRLPKAIDATRFKGFVTYRGGEVVSRNNRPRRRRQPRPLIDSRTIAKSLRGFGASEEEIESLGVTKFLTRGLGDQLSFHIYDAEPTFAFRFSQFVGRSIGRRGRGFDEEMLLWLPLVSSLNSPIYLTLPVADEQIVDQFLQRLDQILAKAARRPMGRGWFSFDTDFYRFTSEEHTVRCFAWEFFSFRFRFFVARVEGALVIATQPFIMYDLFELAAADTNVAPDPDSVAHLLVRVRPKNWDRVLADFRLGWAESNRTSCLKNLGPLSGIVRAYGGTGRQALDLARDLHGVRYFCPEGGRYEVVATDNPENSGRQQVRCSLHGDANAPRQPTAPVRDSQLDHLLSEFAGMTAALTFTEDGLRAVLRIDRQRVDPKAQQP